MAEEDDIEDEAEEEEAEADSEEGEGGPKKKGKKKSCDRARYVSTSLTDLLLARVQA